MEKKKAAIAAISVVAIVLVIALPIALISDGDNSDDSQPIDQDNPFALLQSKIENDKIREYLEVFAAKPHVAGSYRDEVELTNFIKNDWLVNNKMDHLEEFKMRVKLSYPNNTNPNYVVVVEPSAEVPGNFDEISSTISTFREPNIEKDGIDMDTDDITNPWLAYTPNGTAIGYPIYVNYGRVEDFDFIGPKKDLAEHATDNLICIIRYGKIFRGNKIDNAEDWGCVGSIIYNDPEQYAPTDFQRYAEGSYLPEKGTQRGSTMTWNGCPMSPGYAAWANDTSTYFDESNNYLYPSGVAQPIGAYDAERYMQLMTAEKDEITTPTEWVGGLNASLVDYSIGPGFAESTQQLKIVSHNRMEYKDIDTVCGYWYGKEEPDRYVVFGNHRDAWAYGAIDPNSGTSAMMEVVRAFGRMKSEEGFVPRRTLMFCSLAAEEFGLMGAYELVEALQRFLHQRSVIYVNMDFAVKGNETLESRGSPHIKDVIMKVTKTIPNPNPDPEYPNELTLYDAWLRNTADSAENVDKSLPLFKVVGSGSDFRAFAQIPGIALIDMRYKSHEPYALYHSQYETTYAVENFVDRGFNCHGAVAKIFASMGYYFATERLLPFNLRNYKLELEFDAGNFFNTQVGSGASATTYEEQLIKYNVDVSVLKRHIEELGAEFDGFQDLVDSIDLDTIDELQLRQVNDVLINIERMFIWPYGLPGREYEDKHLLYAPFKFDVYISTVFPTIMDALYRIDDAGADSDQERGLHKQYAILCSTMKEAIYTLNTSRSRLFSSFDI